MRLRVRCGEGSSTMDLAPGARIYIMGISGVAMSALAGLLKQKGYDVFGSDRYCYSPAKEELDRLHIKVWPDYQVSYMDHVDLVVVGNVVSRHWPVARALLKSKKPYMHLPEALVAFGMEGCHPSVMVTGTHGKTTIASLAAWVLSRCGLNPGFMIGGVAENFKSNFLFNKNAFVVEGDEYDTAFFEKTPKFLHYPASHIILSNAEFDHADIYSHPGEVKAAFRELVKQHLSKAQFIMGEGSEWMRELIKLAGDKALTYGAKCGGWQIIRREAVFEAETFKGQKVYIKEPMGGELAWEIPFPGEHSALNFLSVWVLARLLKLDTEKVIHAFKTFKGVRRRLQILGEFGGVLLIEDFAHHPTAVAAVVRSLREMYPGRRILALFEPRSNTSRRNIFQQEYQAALSLADQVFCMEVGKTANLSESDSFSASGLADTLKSRGKSAFATATVQEMCAMVQKNARPRDVVLAMSNGDFGGIYTLLKNALSD